MEIVEEIRHAANIVEIASQFTTLRKRGRKHVGLCPFHLEKDPSFTVDEEKQLFHCFGCGAGGDVFTLIMEKENLSFPEALRYLAEKYHIKLPLKNKLSPQITKLEDKLFAINEAALTFFKKNLYTSDEGKRALDYLKKRNISESVIQELKVGYALNSWNSLLSFFQQKNVSSLDLERAGLVLKRERKEGYYDRFRGRIIFPIFNLSGKVVAFGGRDIIGAEPKYLNSPDTPLYSKGRILYGLNLSKEHIKEKKEAILVEGYTDFIALYQSGIKNVVATCGTSLTGEQIVLMLRFAPKIILSYDADDAGKAASLRAISLCFENGAQVRVLALPQGFDPDSCLQKFGVEKFLLLINRSTPGLKFLIDYFLEKTRMDVPEEKSKLIWSVIKEIEKIPDSIIRSEYLKQAAEYLKIDEKLLREIIHPKSNERKSEEKEFFLPAEKRLLQILFTDKFIAPFVFSEIREDDYKGLRSEPIFRNLVHASSPSEPPPLPELKKKLEPSLFNALSKALFEHSEKPSVDEARECVFSLRQVSLESKSKKLKAEIALLEKKGDKEKVRALLLERQEIIKELSLLAQRNY